MSKSDFFGDDNTDLVFQNSDGAVALWDMSGASILGAGVVAVNPGPTCPHLCLHQLATFRRKNPRLARPSAWLGNRKNCTGEQV